MSDGPKVEAKKAIERVQIIKAMLADACERIEIAGSLRRGKALVGDAEIVVLPKHAPTLLARLDKMVAERLINKAAYGEKRLTRWGEKYRGLMYQGLRIEIFLADADNWGYVFWLRTGPGDANAWVMQQCIYQQAPYRAIDGYWTLTKTYQRISVPDEREMFRLLGIGQVLEPKYRTIERYVAMMRNVKWADQLTLTAPTPEKPTQTSMF